MGPQTTQAEAKRKRGHETIRLPHVEPRHVLVMDNLKPGLEMANAASMAAAAAGQSHDSP